jgi:pimeloyl-ACP methyl ester carboxylesterase
LEQVYRTYGKALRNIVLVHGGPGAVGEMAEVARALESDFGVIETLHRALTISDQIGELQYSIEKETTKQVYLIGFSWGAWLSLLFTSKHKQYVKKLILIGCGPLEAKYAKEIYDTRLARLNEQEQKTFKSLIGSLSKQTEQDHHSIYDELGILIRKTDCFDPLHSNESNIEIFPEVYGSVWQEADKLRKEGKLVNTLKNFDVPIYVLHGNYDPHPVAGILNPLRQYKKDFQYEILQQCGHKPWIEKHARTRFYYLLRENISA